MDIPSSPFSTISLTAHAPAASSLPPLSPDQRALIQAVKAVNASGLFGADHELSFIVNRNTRQVVVRIVDRDTREVVRQIPAEYVLRLAEENPER